MSSGTILFLLLVVGLPLAMMLMHRGGHGSSRGHGGCGGGHSRRDEPTRGGHAGH